MKSRNAIALSILALAFAGFTSAASAQDATQAEAHQQSQQSAQQSSGGTAAGTSETGAPRAATHTAQKSECVGPVSYCNIFFGS
jgi:heat shock protein HslJ